MGFDSEVTEQRGLSERAPKKATKNPRNLLRLLRGRRGIGSVGVLSTLELREGLLGGFSRSVL
jgi:hypothetical protein